MVHVSSQLKLIHGPRSKTGERRNAGGWRMRGYVPGDPTLPTAGEEEAQWRAGFFFSGASNYVSCLLDS